MNIDDRMIHFNNARKSYFLFNGYMEDPENETGLNIDIPSGYRLIDDASDTFTDDIIMILCGDERYHKVISTMIPDIDKFYFVKDNIKDKGVRFPLTMKDLKQRILDNKPMWFGTDDEYEYLDFIGPETGDYLHARCDDCTWIDGSPLYKEIKYD